MVNSKTMQRTLALIIAMLVLPALLYMSGCSLPRNGLEFPPTTKLKQLNVVAEIGANQNTATALDLVFVFDKTALPLLPKTGPDWFANKQALLAGLASGVAVLSLQVPPASKVIATPLPQAHEKAIAVYSYANYLSAAGQAMGDLTPYPCVQITLGSTQISYANCK